MPMIKLRKYRISQKELGVGRRMRMREGKIGFLKKEIPSKEANMKKLAYLSFCLCLFLTLSVQAQEWGLWSELTTTPYNQDYHSAMCYGLYEGECGKLYVLLPSGGNENFWEYDISSDDWNPLAPFRSAVGSGSELCYFYDPDYTEGYIFCTPGGGNEFWYYDIRHNIWRQLEDIPLPRCQGLGMSLTTGDICEWGFPPQTCINIYLLKGVNQEERSNEFLVYHFPILPGPGGRIQQKNWESLQPLDHGEGAAMTYVPRLSALFAFAGGQEFWVYSFTFRYWFPMPSYSPGADIGSALGTWGVCGHELIPGEQDTVIYAFKGGFTNDFHAFRLNTYTWDYNAANVPDELANGIWEGSDLACGYLNPSLPSYRMYGIFGAGYTEPNYKVGAFDPAGFEFGGGQALSINPAEHGLVQISPNPVTEKTVFQFPTHNTSNSNIEIFDNAGKLIQKISVSTGSRKVVWDTKTNDGATVSSGVYFYTVKIGNKSASGKFVIQR